jgi:hypothetical protein
MPGVVPGGTTPGPGILGICHIGCTVSDGILTIRLISSTGESGFDVSANLRVNMTNRGN